MEMFALESALSLQEGKGECIALVVASDVAEFVGGTQPGYGRRRGMVVVKVRGDKRRVAARPQRLL